MADNLVELMADLKEDEVLALTKEKIAAGANPMEILDDARSAMAIVGKRFQQCEYFIPDLIMAGEILKEISDIIKPVMEKEKDVKKGGRVLIGTVAGDIHDIGKDIVTFMLDVSGFNVLDIGVDVSPEVFVEKTREFQPQVIGLSGFLTLAFDSMKATVDALQQAGLRDTVKIMIGGGQMDDEVRKYAGADAFGKDALAAVNLCRQWIGGQQ